MIIARDTVEAGETIVSLSARLTGNPLNYPTIIRLNNLRPPYLTPEPHDGTLSPGDTVLYPAPDEPRTPPDVGALVARTYKRDIKLQGNDLELGNGGMLVTETGLPNLHTALIRRIGTLLGRHPFHPAYGSLLRTHIGKAADYLRLRMVIVDVRRSLLRDPRVQTCTVEATWNEGLLTVDCLITPIAPGSPFRLVESFRTP